MASITTIYTYTFTNNHYRWQANYLSANRVFSDYINNLFTDDNSVIAQPLATRGYANILFQRGIYEFSNEKYIVSEAIKQGKQFSVFLLPKQNSWNMNSYHQAIAYDNLGGSKYLYTYSDDFNEVVAKEMMSIQLAPLTDSNWNNGVSFANPTLLFANVPFNSDKIQGAKSLKTNGVVVSLKSVEINEKWITVSCKDSSDLAKFAFPAEIEVIK